MYILHCLKEETWKQFKGQKYYGQKYIEACGFIHCSEILTYPLVAPNFRNEPESLVLLVVDTSKVESRIEWEDLENCGTVFPHIYGPLNVDAIVEVVPHLWSKDRTWIINDELKEFERINIIIKN